MKNSLAAVFDGHAGQISLRTLPTPDLNGGEILVRVLGCTICGSDVHSFDGRRTVPTPTVLGHEIVGEIVEFGDAAHRVDMTETPLNVGDRVTWAIVAHCGDCSMCQRGLPQKCLRGVKYGHEAFRPGRELLGGMAEHCLLVERTSLVRLPIELPLAVACPASCATATIAAAMEAAGDLSGRRICLLGAGMLGLTACAMARWLGATTIFCVDPVASRRSLARRFGATHVASHEDFREVTKAATVDDGFDVVIELSGKNAALESAWPLVRTGGTVVLVGSVFPAPPVPFVLEQIVRRCLTIRGVHNYAPRHLATAARFLSAQYTTAPFADLVAQWFPLTSIANAFAMSRDPEVVRVGIAPNA